MELVSIVLRFIKPYGEGHSWVIHGAVGVYHRNLQVTGEESLRLSDLDEDVALGSVALSGAAGRTSATS
jgi:hypothetical protein